MGSLGNLSLRFRRRSSERQRLGCRVATLRRGELVGELRFAGENDYATVDLDRVAARIVEIRRTCGRKGHRRASIGEVLSRAGSWRPPFLYACGPAPGTLSIATRDKYLADFLALQFDRTPVASITRIASAIRPAEQFHYRRNLQSATLAPARPFFAGTARYEDGALSGDLRARLPGLGATAMVPGEALLGRSDSEELPDCPGLGKPFRTGRDLQRLDIKTQAHRAGSEWCTGKDEAGRG